jgi:hypothetical protein
MAAVAAFIGTAALAITLTRAPAQNGVSLSSAVSSRVCATSGLEAWLGLGASSAASAGGTGGAGRAGGASRAGNGGRPGSYTGRETYYTLEFTNVSDRACSLYGYPEVSAYLDSPAAGGPVGSAAVRDTSVRPKPVMLEPGATAHAVLRVTASAEPSSCAEVTAGELRITLPRQPRPAFVLAQIPVCSGKGHVSLRVQAIQARPGVPGHTLTP